MDPEIVLESLRRNRRFAIRDIGHRGQTVDQKTGRSGQGRGTNASIIMDNRNLTDDGLARNAMAEIYDPRISRAVTVLHEVGHATGAVPYSREQGHTELEVTPTLTSEEELLFFTLFSLKAGFTYDLSGFVSGMDAANAKRNQQLGLDVLQHTLSAAQCLHLSIVG
jgi:hypothetical protein